MSQLGTWTCRFSHGVVPPRDGWARRQSHETSIHAVDAMAARLERTPVAAETWLKPVMAADGLGELLRGFLPRKRIGRLRSPQPLTVHVRPTDVDMARILRVSEEPTITEVGAVGSPNVVLSGTAVAPYLALWNRGAEVDDPDGFLDRWRRDVAIAWA